MWFLDESDISGQLIIDTSYERDGAVIPETPPSKANWVTVKPKFKSPRPTTPPKQAETFIFITLMTVPMSFPTHLTEVITKAFYQHLGAPFFQ